MLKIQSEANQLKRNYWLMKNLLNNDKDKDIDKKYKMYIDHIIYYQKLNGMSINPYGNTRFLKFVIGKGNNALLSRIALKTRWWWAETKMKEFNFNFIWTQWKSNKVVNHLPKHNCDNKELKIGIKEDVVKYSDSDDVGSLNQSTNDTLPTPSSSKIIKISSDINERKILSTPELKNQNKMKENGRSTESTIVEPMDTENTIIWNHVEGHVQLSNK